MTTPSSRVRAAQPAREALGPWRAALVGVVALILVNAGFIAGTVTIAPTLSDVVQRVLLHTYDAGQHLAVGILAALTIVGWLRVRPARRSADLLALIVVSAILSLPILGPDLVGFSSRHASPAAAPWLRAAMALLVSLGVPAACLGGYWLARPRWRWGGVGAALTLMVLNNLVLPGGDYPGAHFYLAWAAVGHMAGALFSLDVSRGILAPIRPLPVALVGVLVGSTLAIRPPGGVTLQLLGINGSVVMPLLSRVYPEQVGTGNKNVPEPWREWFVPRKNAAAIAPKPTQFPKNGLVVVVSFDALRADFIEGAEGSKNMPNFARVRDEGVHFTQARAPGSQTTLSLTSAFTGVYYSQQYWKSHYKHPDLFPHKEPTIRYPELLSAAGIDTVNMAGSFWFVEEWGVVKGFREARYVEPKHDTHYTPADELMPHFIERLEKQRDRPLFAFIHLFDAHRSISSTRGKGSLLSRYRGGMRSNDEALGQLLTMLDRTGLARRTVLILTADHGEAFGEHGSQYHATTLYDELIRIPLVVRFPGVAPHTVDDAVSLMDLGPTILELFGQPTPGHFLGQSLGGYLGGEAPRPTRPILGEGRLKRYLLFPDGRKAIVDERHHTSELYDLKNDPKELNNLAATPEAEAPIGLLREFFEVHRIRKPGYEIPWRN